MGVWYLCCLAIINIYLIKICYDVIPKARNFGEKFRAWVGLVANIFALIVSVIFLVTYLTI